MSKFTIFKKIQLLTLIAIVSSVSILVYVESAYADEVVAVNDTISINDTVAVNVTKAVETVAVSDIEYEFTGIKINKFGIFDAEDDGNLVNKLLVGQTYYIITDYQSELDAREDIYYFMQVSDKSKILDNVLVESNGHGLMEPSDRMEQGDEFTPKYTGHFKLIVELSGGNISNAGATQQYDFVVIEKPSLKQQIADKTLINDIECKNDSHVLVKRTNDKLACVYSDTVQKFDWKLI